MNARNFENFALTGSGRRAESLLINRTIKPHEMFDAVFEAVGSMRPTMIGGILYTTERLIGPDRWANLSIAERRAAGMCLAYHVNTAAVPLVLHRTPSGKGKKRYLLRPPKPAVGNAEQTHGGTPKSDFSMSSVRGAL